MQDAKEKSFTLRRGRAKASILEYFPYPSIREEQKNTLLAIEKHWDSYECFCIVAPTAAGKTALMKTIAAWRGNASIIVPTNVLVDQMVKAFPGIQKLQKRALYSCPRFVTGLGGKSTISCEEAYKKYGGKKLGCNRDCDYLKDNARARGRGYGVYNYYTYMSNKLYKPTLIADESHNLIKVLQDLGAQKIWRHDFKYPWDMWSASDMLNWIEGVEAASGGELPELLQGLREEITSSSPRYVIKRGRDLWNRTNPPEERELLTMLPVDTSEAPPILWPGGKVQKVVLLSATISYKDVEGMGLGRRRTLYLETDSVIAPSYKPIIFDYVAIVNRNNLKEATINMAKRIVNIYLPRYEGKKGVVHATYAQAKILREYFEAQPEAISSRFLFHTKEDTKAKLDQFLLSPPEDGTVFICSGMYEGIDLADDLGRWQIITKIPWLNLGDPAIKYKAENDPSWYFWETGKSTMQAAGRTSRHETDYSETIIMDEGMERLLSGLERFSLLPNWFKDVIDYSKSLSWEFLNVG